MEVREEECICVSCILTVESVKWTAYYCLQEPKVLRDQKKHIKQTNDKITLEAPQGRST